MEMPLKFLSNKEKDWFILDRDNKSFSIREELAAQWPDTTVRGLMKDRVEYNLARYFYRKQRSLVE